MAKTAKQRSRGATTPTKPVPQKRIKKNQIVYFACRAGNFVIASDDKNNIMMSDGKYQAVPVPGMTIWFTNGQGQHTGVSRGYNPEKPDDARVIAKARALIAAGDDDRVRINAFREVDPYAPTPPLPNWDFVSPHRLVELARDAGLDIAKCLEYEKYYEARPEVVAGLEALLAGEVVEDPLMVPEL